jgi:hypothetical protein
MTSATRQARYEHFARCAQVCALRTIWPESEPTNAQTMAEAEVESRYRPFSFSLSYNASAAMKTGAFVKPSSLH